jgi:hypothetical protein
VSLSSLSTVFESLKRDILAEGGPSISTTRNYSFAILVYPPDKEFEMRKKVRQLSDQLRTEQWAVLDISLQKLLMQRLRGLDREVLEKWIDTEKRQSVRSPDRALERITQKLTEELEGEGGIAADVVREIEKLCETNPGAADRTLIWIRRLGSLYPFYRSSNLLKQLDQQARSLPVILLYPGERHDKTALSLMGEGSTDRDYRARIYSVES